MSWRGLIKPILAVLLCAGAIEAGAAFMEHSPYFTDAARAARASGYAWRYETVDEVARQRRREGLEPQFLGGPILFLADNGVEVEGERFMPLSLVSSSLIVNRSDNGGVFEARTDRYGFRNSDETWDHPVDALLLGNSFVFSSAVADDETIGARLRQSGVNAASVGTGASGPLMATAAAREYGPLLSEGGSVVYFFDMARDTTTMCNEMLSPLLTAYLDDSAYRVDVASHQHAFDAMYRAKFAEQVAAWRHSALVTHLTTPDDLIDLATLGHLRRLLKRTFGWTFLATTEVQPPPPHILGDLSTCHQDGAWTALPTFERALASIKADANARRARALFVILPDWERLSGNPDDKTALLPTITDAAQRAGFAVLDPLPALQNEQLGDVFPAGGMRAHYTPFGFCLVSQAVATELGGSADICANVSRPARAN